MSVALRSSRLVRSHAVLRPNLACGCPRGCLAHNLFIIEMRFLGAFSNPFYIMLVSG